MIRPGLVGGVGLQYATGAYSMRPKANVTRKPVWASGCHELRLLEGRSTYQKGIQFDHKVHLGQMLRGEQLRCTSCHNQIVQYNEEITAEHMAVTARKLFRLPLQGCRPGGSDYRLPRPATVCRLRQSSTPDSHSITGRT